MDNGVQLEAAAGDEVLVEDVFDAPVEEVLELLLDDESDELEEDDDEDSELPLELLELLELFFLLSASRLSVR